MSKTFLLLILTSFFLFPPKPLQAQLPAEKIPAAATLVIRINTPGVLSTDVNEALSTSKMMKELGSWLLHTKTPVDLRQTGFRLQEDAWFYTFNTDSIFYNVALIPLADAGYLDSVHQQELSPVPGNATIRRWQNPNGESALFWNDTLLVAVNGSSRYAFFTRPEVEKRYGIPQTSYGAATPVQPATPGYMEADPVYVEAYTTPYPVVTETAADSPSDSINYENVPVPQSAPPPPMILTAPGIPDDSSYMAAEQMPDDTPAGATDGYEDIYTQKRRIRDSLTGIWQEAFALQHFSSEFPKQVFLVRDKRLKKDAEHLADIWMPHVGGLYANLLQGFLGPADIPGYLKGIGSMGLHLKADKHALRLEGRLAFEGKQGKELLKFYRKKINPQLLRYVGSGAIGFLGYSLDMQKYLESMPDWMGDNYAELLGTEEELIRLALDVFSVLLDEKAAAKLMKGDFLLVLSGISEQEQAYTAYEYDEETFESKRIEKTKKELVPEGRLMFTTGEPELWGRLFSAGARQELLDEVRPGIFRYNKKGAFPFYFMVHNDVVFAGTALTELSDIQADKPLGKPDNRQRRLLRRNALSGYFNPQRMAFNLTRLEGNKRSEGFQSAIQVLNRMGPVSFGVKRQGYYLQGGLTGHTGSENDQNGFAYLLELIAMLEKI